MLGGAEGAAHNPNKLRINNEPPLDEPANQTTAQHHHPHHPRLFQPSNMAAKASVLLVATLVVLSFFSAAHASSCAGDITTAGKDMGVVVADIGSDVAECVWGSKASCSRT